MTVVADITISLDGYVTGADAGPDAGLGSGGEPLHNWVMHADDVDRSILESSTARSGAVVMGRNLFDVIDGPHGWNDEMGYGADQAGTPPFFVVTHHAPTSVRLDLDFTFVTDGVASAVAQAVAVAGDRDVVVMGGGDVIRQCVESGIADELCIHLAPMLLGEGTPLFRPGFRSGFEIAGVQPSANATHITYRMQREEPS